MNSNNTTLLSQTIPIMQKDINHKTLIFLENENQVRDCLQWLSDIDGDKIIIALSPLAMYELDKHRISYKIQEEYYEPQELYEFGMKNFQTVEELCGIIDEMILKSCPSANQRNITPALFSFYHLKMVYDAMTIRIFQLSNIFNTEKPDIVYMYNTEIHPFGFHENAPFIQFDDRESLYTQLMELGGWKINVKIIQSSSKFEHNILKKENVLSVVKFKSYVVKRLLDHPELFDLAMMIKKRGFVGLFNWLKYMLHSSDKRTCIALLGGGYNWDDSIIKLKAQQISPIYRLHYDANELISDNIMDFKGLNNAWMELIKKQDFLNFFVFNGIDFFPIVRGRLQFLVNRLTVSCVISACNTEYLIKQKKIKAFISSSISNCLEHSVAQVAHNSAIPVITWQHGAYGAMQHPIINYLDLISSNFHFVFGKGVEKQYIQPAKSYGTKLISIGSTSLGVLQIRSKKKKHTQNKKKRILYITSSGYQNKLYISYYPPFSDNRFWQTQKAIIDILGKHDAYSVIVKLHPGVIHNSAKLSSYVADKGYINFTFIMGENTVGELLRLSDIVVIDMPSTTLLQALTTTKPIFAYMGHIKFDTKSSQLLEKRIVCLEKIEDFICKLDNYLYDGNYAKDLANNDFLQLFGTTHDCNFVAQQATKKLRQIIDTYDDNK